MLMRERRRKDIRGMRRHYAWLRKMLGRKKLLKKIKAIGQKEKRKVTNRLHEISNTIILWAEKTKAIIVLGDLKGIRKSAKGRVMRRLLSAVPFYKLTHMLSYKAEQHGLQVFRIDESYTSKQCHKCNCLGTRDKQASFSCANCGLVSDSSSMIEHIYRAYQVRQIFKHQTTM